MKPVTLYVKLFIITVVVVLSGCLLLSCDDDDDDNNDEYDIRGTWTIEFKWNSMNQARIIWQEFTGNKDYGTWTNEDYGSGAWKVTGASVEWSYYGGGDAVYTGTITDANNMSGAMSSSSDTGTWSAVR